MVITDFFSLDKSEYAKRIPEYPADRLRKQEIVKTRQIIQASLSIGSRISGAIFSAGATLGLTVPLDKSVVTDTIIADPHGVVEGMADGSTEQGREMMTAAHLALNGDLQRLTITGQLQAQDFTGSSVPASEAIGVHFGMKAAHSAEHYACTGITEPVVQKVMECMMDTEKEPHSNIIERQRRRY
ncbi:MAG: hypothetical protein M1834_007115 [Cirrosporium novae-zelandiae]|nr:MAG: hypothetical protein M1834_007115 [Cirrosporium novae-zelandiae]